MQSPGKMQPRGRRRKAPVGERRGVGGERHADSDPPTLRRPPAFRPLHRHTRSHIRRLNTHKPWIHERPDGVAFSYYPPSASLSPLSPSSAPASCIVLITLRLAHPSLWCASLSLLRASASVTVALAATPSPSSGGAPPPRSPLTRCSRCPLLAAGSPADGSPSPGRRLTRSECSTSPASISPSQRTRYRQ